GETIGLKDIIRARNEHRRHLRATLADRVNRPGCTSNPPRSRVGFVHQFQPLSGRELQNVIEQQWVQLELDTQMHEPPTEIERVLAVNRLTTVTTEVVAFARESLVIGPPDSRVTRH